MAEAPTNPLPSGYDEGFVNAVEDDFQCLICHLPLKEPVQTRCGHRFCKECLEEHFKRQEVLYQPITCPVDREDLNRDRDVFPDKATERKILSFAIKCPSEGCEWTGELRSKEIHLASCLFKLVICTNENCYVAVQRRRLEEHVIVTCPWRILECDHCNEPHPECKMKDHIGQCSKVPVTCPNSCGVLIPREMIQSHTNDDCLLTLIPCPYVKMGFKTKVRRTQVESHLQSAVRLHLDLACVKLEDIEQKLNDTQVKLFDTEVTLSDTQAKLNTTRRELNETEETTKIFLEKMDSLQMRFEEKILEDRKNVLEEKIAILENTGFVWKVKNFSEHLRQAKNGEKKIESVAFYTEKCGYKLSLCIYPNGNGIGLNTHLTVFIIVNKGEYDAILPWPFTRKVKFTLIDQQEDPVKRENHGCELIPRNIECFQRPKSKEKNGGRGFVKFISHEKLNSRRYLVDDTLFLKVDVCGPSIGV